MSLNGQRVDNYRIRALEDEDFSVFVEKIDIIMSSTCCTRNAIKAGGKWVTMGILTFNASIFWWIH